MAGSEFVIEGFTHDDERCEVRVRVPEDLRYFEGHFEGDPIVPGIAQLVPLIWDQARRAWPDLPAPTAVKRLKFRDALRPGHALTVALTRAPGRLTFEVRRGEILSTKGVLTLGS